MIIGEQFMKGAVSVMFTHTLTASSEHARNQAQNW